MKHRGPNRTTTTAAQRAASARLVGAQAPDVAPQHPTKMDQIRIAAARAALGQNPPMMAPGIPVMTVERAREVLEMYGIAQEAS